MSLLETSMCAYLCAGREKVRTKGSNHGRLLSFIPARPRRAYAGGRAASGTSSRMSSLKVVPSTWMK